MLTSASTIVAQVVGVTVLFYLLVQPKNWLVLCGTTRISITISRLHLGSVVYFVFSQVLAWLKNTKKGLVQLGVAPLDSVDFRLLCAVLSFD